MDRVPEMAAQRKFQRKASLANVRDAFKAGLAGDGKSHSIERWNDGNGSYGNGISERTGAAKRKSDGGRRVDNGDIRVSRRDLLDRIRRVACKKVDGPFIVALFPQGDSDLPALPV